MHPTNTPNCNLEAILVPEPVPQLKFFVVAPTRIHPYTSLYASAPLRNLPLNNV